MLGQRPSFDEKGIEQPRSKELQRVHFIVEVLRRKVRRVWEMSLLEALQLRHQAGIDDMPPARRCPSVGGAGADGSRCPGSTSCTSGRCRRGRRVARDLGLRALKGRRADGRMIVKVITVKVITGGVLVRWFKWGAERCTVKPLSE